MVREREKERERKREREREKKSRLTIGKNCLGGIRLSFNQAPFLAADAKSGAGSASGDRESPRWDKAHRLPDSLELDVGRNLVQRLRMREALQFDFTDGIRRTSALDHFIGSRG